jgi:hypothetical protein
MQVTAMILCLISVLFNGTAGTMPANDPSTFGWVMMRMSFARFTVGGLFIASVMDQPPALMQQANHGTLQVRHSTPHRGSIYCADFLYVCLFSFVFACFILFRLFLFLFVYPVLSFLF